MVFFVSTTLVETKNGAKSEKIINSKWIFCFLLVHLIFKYATLAVILAIIAADVDNMCLLPPSGDRNNRRHPQS